MAVSTMWQSSHLVKGVQEARDEAWLAGQGAGSWLTLERFGEPKLALLAVS